MALPLIKRLGTVFAVALALRVAASLWLNLAPAWMQPTFFVVTADSATYREAALGILAGQGYRLSGSEEAASSVAPLFSYFLAGVYATVGSSPLTVSLVHSLIDAGTAVLLVLIVGTCFARRDGPTDVGFLAGMIYAVFPFSVFCAPRVLKEALAVFLTVLSAGLWIRLLRCTSWNAARGWSLASGLALGLGTLMRFFNGILFLTVVACDVALVARRARGPWLLRQERLFGSMVLSTHGPMRYLDRANSIRHLPETDGYYEGDRAPVKNPLPPPRRVTRRVTRPGSGGAEARHAVEAWHNLATHPLHVLTMVAAKVVNMWRPVWAGSSWRGWLVLGLPYLALLLLALRGMALAWREARADRLACPTELAAFTACMLTFVVPHLALYAMIRHRLYVYPFLAGFAAWALTRPPEVRE